MTLSHIKANTTVQEKVVIFPTDAILYHRMREKLVNEAKVSGVELRQSYKRLSKNSLLMQGHYHHARQGKCANKKVRKLKAYLDRVVLDIERKVSGDLECQARFSPFFESAN